MCFRNICAYGARVIQYWTIFSKKLTIMKYMFFIYTNSKFVDKQNCIAQCCHILGILQRSNICKSHLITKRCSNLVQFVWQYVVHHCKFLHLVFSAFYLHHHCEWIFMQNSNSIEFDSQICKSWQIQQRGSQWGREERSNCSRNNFQQSIEWIVHVHHTYYGVVSPLTLHNIKKKSNVKFAKSLNRKSLIFMEKSMFVNFF
jgi:hypothetical protein